MDVLLLIVACHPEEGDHTFFMYVLKTHIAPPCTQGIRNVPLYALRTHIAPLYALRILCDLSPYNHVEL